MKTYLFYDLETSGINKCFDQIMQFAAIRTNENLQELERYEFFVKINPDTLIDPEALIVHHISLTKANNDGISEYDAVKKIHELINMPETVSIGYNTLGFDDEFLRFAFHKNLLPVYEHQFMNSCYRMDLYPMLIAYFLYDKQRINIPLIDKKPSLKLENINKENSLVMEGRAHDALVDVEVTIALARKLKENKDMWDYLEDSFIKSIDARRKKKLVDKLNIADQLYDKAILLNGKFGKDANFHTVALDLGQHWHYKNQNCWLRLDLPDLIENTVDNSSKHAWIINKKWGEPPIMLPCYNRYLEHLGADRIAIIAANQQWLQNNPEIFLAIKETALDYKYPLHNNIDFDANLYQSGFMKPWEKKLCHDFHTSSFANKSKLITSQLKGDIKKRAVRILGRLSQTSLSDEHKQEFKNYLNRIISTKDADLPIDFKGIKRRSLTNTFTSIEKLMSTGNLSLEQNELLLELKQYLSNITPTIAKVTN